MAFSTLTSPTSLSHDDADELRATAKWARLVAILGFVFLGLMVLLGGFYGAFMTKVMGAAAANGAALPYDPAVLSFVMIAVFLLVAVIYFFPLLFLYRYATRTLKALSGPFDASAFSLALRSHRSFYGYIAVLMIVGVIIYTLVLVSVVIATAFLNSQVQAAGAGM